MDKLYVPLVVLLDAEMVSVVVPVLVRVVGLRVAVTPVGFPVTMKDTEELNPPAIVSVTWCEQLKMSLPR
jgi:hypothetical protein